MAHANCDGDDSNRVGGTIATPLFAPPTEDPKSAHLRLDFRFGGADEVAQRVAPYGGISFEQPLDRGVGPRCRLHAPSVYLRGSGVTSSSDSSGKCLPSRRSKSVLRKRKRRKKKKKKKKKSSTSALTPTRKRGC